MAQAVYITNTGAAPFTSTAVAQTVLAVVNAGTDFALQLKKYRIAFNGVTASNPPVTVRLFTTNNATAGTSSAATITQSSGRALATTNITAAQQYTAEPTTKTYFDEFLLTPNGGVVIYDYPLGDEPDTALTSTMGIEITASVAVGVSAALVFTRI
jgi:hypothetical protein